jgi:S-DNA-T family DNA segregation ATPase FtsK/SpoIIIE
MLALFSDTWLALEYGVPTLAGGRVAYAAARFAMLPRAAKRNYPAALWASWRWRALTSNLGLTYEDKHRRGLLRPRMGTVVKVQGSGVDVGVVKLRHPRAKFRADAFGVVARVKTVPKVGRRQLEDNAEHIANAWRCYRVQVSQPEPGRITVRGLRTDPLMLPLPAGLAPERPAPPFLWLGRDEYGADRFAELPRLGGITVGGLTGFGKTSLINGWLMQLAVNPAVQFALIDGKGAADLADWEPRSWMFSGDELPAAAAALEDVHALMRARFAAGCRNLWHTGPTEDTPLIVVVVDECHSFLDLEAVKGDKQAEQYVRTCRAMLGQLVRKGRAAMVLSVLLTQKPTGDSIPTFIRDNAGLGLCFATKTTEAAVAALGEDIRAYPSYSPTTLQDPAYVGACTASLRTGMDPFVRLRTPTIDPDEVLAMAASTAGLRRIPGMPLAGISTTTPATAAEPVRS